MKTKDEFDALKEKVATANKKLAELTEEEMKQMLGGMYAHLEETLGSEIKFG